jgi:5-methyltetrahydropteroyltriglutamate--homocysteine methyltransferase
MVARETRALDATQIARLPHLVRDAVKAVLRRQAESGIDVVSDGEQGKIGPGRVNHCHSVVPRAGALHRS